MSKCVKIIYYNLHITSTKTESNLLKKVLALNRTEILMKFRLRKRNRTSGRRAL